MRRALILLPFLMACSSNGKKGIEATTKFFHCIKTGDLQCLWDMSGEETHRTFTGLASKLVQAKQVVNTEIPPGYRNRYIRGLMLDKVYKTTTGRDLFFMVIDARQLMVPEGLLEKLKSTKTHSGYTVWLSDGSTIDWIKTKGGLKTELLGEAFLNLPLYQTFQQNLKVLDHDAKLFATHRRGNTRLPSKQ